jgi:hypothetical protein
MSIYDKPIWDKFITDEGKGYTGFDYDVCVGLGAQPEEIQDDIDREIWNAVKMKRIDAIGYTPTEIHIFEVKPIANAHGLGQVQMYEYLYGISHKPDLPTKKFLVCAAVDDDIEKLAQLIGVSIVKVTLGTRKAVEYATEPE